jgi:hypothetical protein
MVRGPGVADMNTDGGSQAPVGATGTRAMTSKEGERAAWGFWLRLLDAGWTAFRWRLYCAALSQGDR